MVSQNYGRWQQWLDRIRIDGCLALFGNSDDDDEPSCILPRRRQQPCPNPPSRVTTNTFYLLLNSLTAFFFIIAENTSKNICSYENKSIVLSVNQPIFDKLRFLFCKDQVCLSIRPGQTPLFFALIL